MVMLVYQKVHPSTHHPSTHPIHHRCRHVAVQPFRTPAVAAAPPSATATTKSRRCSGGSVAWQKIQASAKGHPGGGGGDRTPSSLAKLVTTKTGN